MMNSHFKRRARILTVAVGVVIGGCAALAMAVPFFEVKTPDYTKNAIYLQGQREGHSDFAMTRDHSRKRIFNIDEDRKAYEAGYLKGYVR
jgi:hypothetical protein